MVHSQALSPVTQQIHSQTAPAAGGLSVKGSFSGNSSNLAKIAHRLLALDLPAARVFLSATLETLHVPELKGIAARGRMRRANCGTIWAPMFAIPEGEGGRASMPRLEL